MKMSVRLVAELDTDQDGKLSLAKILTDMAKQPQIELSLWRLSTR